MQVILRLNFHLTTFSTKKKMTSKDRNYNKRKILKTRRSAMNQDLLKKKKALKEIAKVIKNVSTTTSKNMQL